MDQDEKYAGVSREAVQARTGKTWDEWFTVLDVAGAKEMSHPEIARYLAEQHQVPDWWCQMVTVGYEQARGLRARYQHANGYSVSASRTVRVPIATLFAAWSDEAARNRWLPDAPITVRKATPNKSLRIAWGDGSSLDVEFYMKGESRSQVTVQHSKLPDAETAAGLKAYWQAAMKRLEETLAD